MLSKRWGYVVLSWLHRTTKHGQQFLVKWRDLPYDQATWEKLTETSPIRLASYVTRDVMLHAVYLFAHRGAAYALKQYDHFKNMMETAHNKKERKKKRDRKKLTDVRYCS